MSGPVWDKKRGIYIDQYRDTAYEGTDRMPDNGPDGEELDQNEAEEEVCA